MSTIAKPRAADHVHRLSIDEVFGLIHPRLTREAKVLAVVTAYLDESADGRQEHTFAIGGWIGIEDDWRILEMQWMSATHGLKSFHMTDCESLFGEFSGWTKDRATSLVKELIGAIDRTRIVGFGSAVMLEDFEDVFPTGTPLRFARQIAFGHCVVQMAEWASLMGGLVAFVFDQNPEFSGEAHNLYNSIRASKSWRFHHLLGSLTFAPRESFIGLQAADLFAYESFKSPYNKRFSPNRDMRLSLKALLHRSNLYRWTESALYKLAEEMNRLGDKFDLLHYLDVTIKRDRKTSRVDPGTVNYTRK